MSDIRQPNNIFYGGAIPPKDMSVGEFLGYPTRRYVIYLIVKQHI
jgi:hypothetical protein